MAAACTTPQRTPDPGTKKQGRLHRKVGIAFIGVSTAGPPMVGLVFCLPGGSWKPGPHPPPPGLVEHAKLSQRVEAGGGGHQGGTGGAGPGLGGLSPRPNKGGSLPRRDRQEAPRVGPQESRALQKPQPYPVWPGAGVPENWAVGSLTKGSPSHPRAGSLGPGVGGRTVKALTRGAEAGRRKPEAWGPGRASGAGGWGQSLQLGRGRLAL